MRLSPGNYHYSSVDKKKKNIQLRKSSIPVILIVRAYEKKVLPFILKTRYLHNRIAVLYWQTITKCG